MSLHDLVKKFPKLVQKVYKNKYYTVLWFLHCTALYTPKLFTEYATKPC